MSIFALFGIFLYVGLFTVGGGLASIPLMVQTIVDTGVISETLFYNMVAISESTPGPIGINLATYIGFMQHGILGGVALSLAIAIPCFCISLVISKMLQKFSGLDLVQYAFYGIRPCVTGLIATSALAVLKLSLSFGVGSGLLDFIDWKALALFAVISLLYVKLKKQPVFYIVIGALAGIVIF